MDTEQANDTKNTTRTIEDVVYKLDHEVELLKEEFKNLLNKIELFQSNRKIEYISFILSQKEELDNYVLHTHSFHSGQKACLEKLKERQQLELISMQSKLDAQIVIFKESNAADNLFYLNIKKSLL